MKLRRKGCEKGSGRRRGRREKETESGEEGRKIWINL